MFWGKWLCKDNFEDTPVTSVPVLYVKLLLFLTVRKLFGKKNLLIFLLQVRSLVKNGPTPSRWSTSAWKVPVQPGILSKPGRRRSSVQEHSDSKRRSSAEDQCSRKWTSHFESTDSQNCHLARTTESVCRYSICPNLSANELMSVSFLRSVMLLGYM